MLFVIITTIQQPTDSVKKLAAKLANTASITVVVGDSKGPAEYELRSVASFRPDQLDFWPLDRQHKELTALSQKLPTKHYCRKNLGYLVAIRSGAACIYETDDDNAPLSIWKPREEWIEASPVQAPSFNSHAWCNVYRYFTKELIWPRGLPLDSIHTHLEMSPIASVSKRVWAPIQQGLADGAPDVDAIWRLVLDREFRFNESGSIYLPAHQWCPFNTQSTWWWPAVYPLLYVPSYCSFRMCDIWKSFVAQRCLWELGTGVVFHGAEVWQERNPHNLMRDFNDEVPGYQLNARIADVLEGLSLKRGKDTVLENLIACYRTLVDEGIFPEKELELVHAWADAIVAT